MTQRVLVVDDDQTVSDVIRRYLENDGFQVSLAADGAAALAAVERQAPHLVVLDLMLPLINGLEVCRALRVRPDGVPIVMLTARGDESDRVLGLQLGADDYLTKPFSPRELVLRVRSVLRRAGGGTPPERPEALTDGNLVVHTASRTARLAGADSHSGSEVENEDLAITDPAGLSCLTDSLDRGINHFVDQNHFDLHLRKKIHDIFSAAIKLGMTFLTAKTLSFGNGDTLQADLLKGFLHFVELERLDDCLDLFHGSADSD